MADEHGTARTLEELLDAGEVEAALILKGDWPAEVVPYMRHAWEEGLRQGKALGAAREQTLRQRIEDIREALKVGNVEAAARLAALAADAPAPERGQVVCINCGAEVWWGLPRPEDPCYECGKPIALAADAPAPEETPRLQINPEPLAVVERRDNVTAVQAIGHRSRADRLRVWLALGGTEEEFDEDYPATGLSAPEETQT